jgi:hypothetical protein
LAIATKVIAGEKPSAIDYKNAGQGLSGWINNTFGNSGSGFAGGGEVGPGMFNEDMTNVIAKSVEDSISPKIDAAIQDLMKNLMLKSSSSYSEKTPTEVPGQPGQMAPGSVPGGQLTIEQLVGLAKGAGFGADEAVIMAAIAMGESGGNSNRTNFVPPDKSYGLWQINMIGGLGPARLREFGLSSEDQLLDPVTNAKAAYAIRKSQGLSAWTVYKAGIYKNFLAQAQAAKGAPSLATSPVSGTVKGYDGYITGDPSSPNYAPDHGGSNYHDHLSFKDRATAERAYKFFQSKGFKVTEFKGYDRVGRHSTGSLHYSGLAFDVPGSQVPVGQEQGLSRRVRSTLSEFQSLKAMAKGGLVRGMTRAIIGEKGPEFVLDSNTTTALEKTFPGFLDALNKANYNNAIQVLRDYASYESGSEEQIVVQQPAPEIVYLPMPMPMGSGMGFGGGGSSPDSDYDMTYMNA